MRQARRACAFGLPAVQPRGARRAIQCRCCSSGTAGASTVAAYSVGQQIVIAAATLATGFAALVGIFRIRSFKEAIRMGQREREAEKAAAREDAEAFAEGFGPGDVGDAPERAAATAGPDGPRERARRRRERPLP